MTRPSWIRNLTSRLATNGRRRGSPPTGKKRPSRLFVEPLEDRCVPATFNVINNLDTGAGSLRQAITDANANAGADIITFNPSLFGSTITLTTGALPNIADPLTITGLRQDGLTISGNNASRVFVVNATVAATITDLTITGGNSGAANAGGAILNNGILTLTNVTISNSTAPGAGNSGGAIDSTGAGAKLTATNSTFSNNTAQEGGAIRNEAASLASLTGCTITQNTGLPGGDGAGIRNDGQLTLTSSSVTLNTGQSGSFFGGGIFNSGSLAVTASSVVGNTSQGSGGGIQSSGALFNVTNSTIANNLSLGGSGGGGIRVPGGPLTLLNSTITGNNDASGAATNAGGVSFGGTTLTMSNTIIAQNFATLGGSPPDIRAAVAGGSVNNFIGIGDATLTGITNGTDGNQIGTIALPLDPLLGPLQDNGTPPSTTTPPPTGAAILLTRKPLPGSPVINTGSNVAASTLSTDERGFLRIINGIVDIGAVEFQTPQTTTTLTVTPASPTATNVSVTLTATVTPAATSPAPNNPVTGKVTFFNGTTVLGTATLDATGKATLTTNLTTNGVTVPALPVGTNALSARYEGDANYSPSVSATVNQVVANRKITPGVYDPTTGTWSLRNTNTAGAADTTLAYGPPGSGVFPVVGDWLGTGVFTVGIFIQATATFQIRFSNTPGAPDVTFAFGPSGTAVPVAGDWNGDGKWGIGVFDSSRGFWNLRNELSQGLPDAGSFLYGAPGSKGVVGDWNGDGKFTIGVIEPDGTWKLKDDNVTGPPNFTFAYGALTDTPIAGDWDANGTWTPGVVRPTGAAPTWLLRNSNSAGAPDITPFDYGTANSLPAPGSWVFPGLPLKAADGEGPGADTLDPKALPGIISAAMDRLQQAGVDKGTLALLSTITVQTRPLQNGELGESLPSKSLIYIDETAAGHGWFVDQTPGQDEEYAGGVALAKSAAAGRMDLLTALLHEYGHIAGLPEDATGLMGATLATGTRYTDALDTVFGSGK